MASIKRLLCIKRKFALGANRITQKESNWINKSIACPRLIHSFFLSLFPFPLKHSNRKPKEHSRNFPSNKQTWKTRAPLFHFDFLFLSFLFCAHHILKRLNILIGIAVFSRFSKHNLQLFFWNLGKKFILFFLSFLLRWFGVLL